MFILVGTRLSWLHILIPRALFSHPRQLAFIEMYAWSSSYERLVKVKVYGPLTRDESRTPGTGPCDWRTWASEQSRLNLHVLWIEDSRL